MKEKKTGIWGWGRHGDGVEMGVGGGIQGWGLGWEGK